MDRPTWAPPEIDLDRPSPARIYDYMLGGMHNFAVDRAMAEQVLAVGPFIRPMAHANRAFLRRAVEFLTAAGIRQFLDLGSGIPTAGNVHEVAGPDARVAYVDIDPVAVAHSRAIVDGDDRVTVVQADVRLPASILTDPAIRTLLDFDQPIAVLMVGLLHFIPDEDKPADIVAVFRDAVVPGSYLALSQVSPPKAVTPEQEAVAERYRRANPVAMRDRAEIEAFFTGLQFVPPGLVEPGNWRPEPDDPADPNDLMASYAGVGIKGGHQIS